MWRIDNDAVKSWLAEEGIPEDSLTFDLKGVYSINPSLDSATVQASVAFHDGPVSDQSHIGTWAPCVYMERAQTPANQSTYGWQKKVWGAKA
jgi:hypothetical protein